MWITFLFGIPSTALPSLGIPTSRVMNPSDRQTWVWRMPGEHYPPKCIGANCKVCWTRNTFLSLARSLSSSEGNLNTTTYNDIPDDSVLPTLWKQFGESPFLFQQDNAPMHKAGSIQVCRDRCGITWLSCTEPRPQHHRTALGWIGTTANQA